MKQIKALLLMVLLAASGTLLAAQLYRWVDDKGRVEWRDTPPPSSAKKVEQRTIGGSTIETSTLPYSVQVAAKNFPVTLWITDCGDACTQARAHLARRGVPHNEKDPREDFENFKKLTGSAEVPVLFVGSSRLKGYLDSAWDTALDIAGYPRTALVKPQPKSQPKPPAVKSAPAEKGAAAPAAAPTGGVRLYTTADCGPNCADAKRILAARGVSFQEITIENEPQAEELKKMTGDTVVPVLHLGSFWLQGYSPADYENALDKAGYKRPVTQ